MSKKVTEQLDIEETTRYVNLGIPILVYAVNGKKIYYKLRTLTIEESQHISTCEHELTHQLVPLSSEEMKEYGIEESCAQPIGEEVDIEESAAQPVVEEKKSNLTLSGDKDAVRTARKILEANMGSAKPILNDKEEELQEENEDLKNKLGIIAEKRLDEKRKAVSEKVNSLIRDPSKRAEILEQIKTGNPAKVSSLDETMDLLQSQLKPTPERFEPAGSAPMNPQQMGYGQQQATDLAHRKFANIETAIATLQNERRNGGAQAAEADRLLNLLWKKGLGAWREAGHPSQTYSPDSNMEKSNAVPDINFENPKVSEESGFPQLKRTPYGYSRTHNAAGQPKE